MSDLIGPWTVEKMVKQHQSHKWSRFHPIWPTSFDADLALFRELATKGRGTVMAAVSCGICSETLWRNPEADLANAKSHCGRCHGDGYPPDNLTTYCFEMSEAWAAELRLPDPLEVLMELLAVFKTSKQPLGPKCGPALKKARDAVKRIQDAKSEAT